MKARIVLIGALALSPIAHAFQPIHPPGLLPAATARPLLEQDPQVAAARAGLEVAQQDAALLENSPYEWTAKVTGQRRELESGPRYREWNAGMERTIRLPGKAAADHKIGIAVAEESQARYGDAMHDAARELMTLWVDWLAAERAHELAAVSLQSVQKSLAAVEKRVRAGDASKLDLGVARAELAEQRRVESDARTLLSTSWIRLSTRFPGVTRQTVALPAPLPVEPDVSVWQERVLAESNELKVIETQLRQMQGQAERARADRLPDPTVGVFVGSESGGRERISGITLSIPIPGGARNTRSARAAAAVNVSYQEIELKKRQLISDIRSTVATARGSYDSLQIANEGAVAMQDNATLMQRAYSLGEADLQSLLLAQRQANAAANNALQARAAALKAYYGLLIDARLIWDLARD